MALRVEKSDHIALVTLDRPPVNALTLVAYEELADLFASADTWSDTNCLILTAEGTKAFCAGLDLNEFLSSTVEDDPRRAAIIRRCFAAIRHAPVPVIAAVNGPALGAGCVIASVCDIRIATEHARFGMPEINVGRCGGASHMQRHLPQGMLRRMYFTGQPISAQEAWRFGFVQEVVASSELVGTVRDLAQVIAAKAPLGLRAAKEALNAVEFMQTEPGYELEQGYSTRLMTTDDAREATRAVIEKRPPIWVGH
jgi:enoyl-CoA hydratase